MSKLDQEEREILDAFESGNVKRAKKAAEIQKRHQEYVKAMFRKDARINKYPASSEGSPRAAEKSPR